MIKGQDMAMHNLKALGLWCAVLLCMQGTALAQEAEAPKSDDPSAISALDVGRRLYFEGNFEGALKAWQPLAAAGDPRALYNIATLYRRGLAVERDMAKAENYLRQSAEKGFVQAQYLIAVRLFETADSDEVAKQEAVRWWLAAARQAHDLSQYRLGLLYWNGDAVARDLVRGHAWMQLAAKAGLAEAESALSKMQRYLDERQLAKSDSLAQKLLNDGDAYPQTTFEAQKDPTASQQINVSGTDRKSAAAKATTGAETAAATAPETGQATAGFTAQWRLQLLALRDRDQVDREWERISKDVPDLVMGLSAKVVSADLGDRGVFYRLQLGTFASRSAANSRCEALKAAGHGCFLLAPQG